MDFLQHSFGKKQSKDLKENPQHPRVFWNYQILHHYQMITFLITNVNNEICLLRICSYLASSAKVKRIL